MPERVRAPAIARFFQPQVLKHFSNHLRDPGGIGEQLPPPIPEATCMLQVLDHHLGGRAEESRPRLALALHEPHGPVLDVDVSGLDLGKLTDPGAGIVQESHEDTVSKCVLRGGLGEGVSQALGYVFLIEPPAELLALLLLALSVADPMGGYNGVPSPLHEDSGVSKVLLDGSAGTALAL
jgi:hypothetical protein